MYRAKSLILRSLWKDMLLRCVCIVQTGMEKACVAVLLLIHWVSSSRLLMFGL